MDGQIEDDQGEQWLNNSGGELFSGDGRKNELTLQRAQATPPGQTEDQRGNYPAEETGVNVNLQSSGTPKW